MKQNFHGKGCRYHLPDNNILSPLTENQGCRSRIMAPTTYIDDGMAASEDIPIDSNCNISVWGFASFRNRRTPLDLPSQSYLLTALSQPCLREFQSASQLRNFCYLPSGERTWFIRLRELRDVLNLVFRIPLVAHAERSLAQPVRCSLLSNSHLPPNAPAPNKMEKDKSNSHMYISKRHISRVAHWRDVFGMLAPDNHVRCILPPPLHLSEMSV